MSKNTFWSRAESYPPILVRLLARHRGGPALTTVEISDRSGMSEFSVNNISRELSWNDVTFSQMEAFLKACDLDLCDPAVMHRVDNYMKSANKFKYLKRSPEWKIVLAPLVKRFRTLEPK